MLLPRIIPVLLIRNKGLVKTTQFKNDKYVGDPLNAVRIFNEKKVDELTVFDIDASTKGLEPDFGLIEKLAAECRMPLCYGGGINNVSDANRILSLGVEKVSISSSAHLNPQIISDLSNQVGSQSVVVTLDIKKKFFGGYEVYINNGQKNTKKNPISLAKEYQDLGAGEIIINSIDRDGMMNGYELDIINEIKKNIKIPLTCVGGAGSLKDIAKLIDQEKLVGAAAGSLFVFKGKYKAVLITYPSTKEKHQAFGEL